MCVLIPCAPPAGQSEANFEDDPQWEVLFEQEIFAFIVCLSCAYHVANACNVHGQVLFEEPFLDLSRSRFPYKSFYIPGVSSRKNSFDRYMVLRNKHSTVKLDSS